MILTICIVTGLQEQVDGWKADLIEDSGKALDAVIDKQPKLQSFKDKSIGYGLFPKVTKGALGIGGAGGKGIVYKDHAPTGQSTLEKVTIGFQARGQQYKEVIFVENEEAFKIFTNKKVKFDGQSSIGNNIFLIKLNNR
jgi:hypothetical protein